MLKNIYQAMLYVFDKRYVTHKFVWYSVDTR